ncbi:uncharacterized protein [Asterias amurensis]|uniref:uncharacterized protein n=1 Tax=Asterias amurensis TaxID=7602 RepID=UPI003AB47CEA
MSQFIRRITSQEVHAAWVIGYEAFPTGEKPLEETYVFRHKSAPELFWGLFENDRLVGNLSATRSSEVHITNYSNNSHEPEGALVCVRTLCVHQDFRNKGVATKLLKHFIQYVQENVKNVRKMGLICHDNLIPMYVKLGFQCRGLSEIPGDPPWYYMERSIGGN